MINANSIETDSRRGKDVLEEIVGEIYDPEELKDRNWLTLVCLYIYIYIYR